MATVEPFEGTRYNPEHVKLGGVLAPPYDVITDEQRDALYGRDLRNIVRIDYGLRFPNDVAGVDDPYTRAASFLEAWRELGVFVRDHPPGYYVVDHHFPDPDGGVRVRRGLLATVAATSWEQSDLRPHERTLRGPKLDRLALMEATRAQTSPVFGSLAGRRRHRRAARACGVRHRLARRAHRWRDRFREVAPLACRRPCACRSDRRDVAQCVAVHRRRASPLRDRCRICGATSSRCTRRAAGRRVRTLPGVSRGCG